MIRLKSLQKWAIGTIDDKPSVERGGDRRVGPSSGEPIPAFPLTIPFVSSLSVPPFSGTVFHGRRTHWDFLLKLAALALV